MNIKLRYARKTDIPILKNLWQICFGDRMRYIDVFFEKMFVAENTVVAEADNRVAGVVYILERTLMSKIFMYGYAIGVFPEYRGNNICEKMLDFIKNKVEKENCIFGLHPANDKLTDFYKRIGLDEMYYLKEVDASEFSSDAMYDLEEISVDEFYGLRKSAFENCVGWNKDALAYILENGEIVKKITLQEKNLYFVLSKQNNGVLVKETNATDDEVKKVSTSIKKCFDTENITYLLSSKSTLQGIIKPMVLGFSDKNPDIYMNLFLD